MGENLADTAVQRENSERLYRMRLLEWYGVTLSPEYLREMSGNRSATSETLEQFFTSRIICLALRQANKQIYCVTYSGFSLSHPINDNLSRQSVINKNYICSYVYSMRTHTCRKRAWKVFANNLLFFFFSSTELSLFFKIRDQKLKKY